MTNPQPIFNQEPGEREYRKAKRVPFWFSVLVMAVFVSTVAGLLWLIGHVEGLEAAIGAIICIVGLSSAWAFAYIAGCEPPEQGD